MKFKAGIKKLAAAATFFSNTLENQITAEQMEEAFEGLEPVINKEGNKEFLLIVDKEQGFAAFLVIEPDNIWIRVEDDYSYAKSNLKNNSYAAQWIRAKYGVFGI